MKEKSLTQGIYGTETKPQIGPFGLQTGQMHVERFFGHNATWYNKEGERLGWGDLSPEDIRRIRDEISEDELFIILKENDAFWQFVTDNKDLMGATAETREKIEKPGIGYIALKARFIIERERIYGVDAGHNYTFSNIPIVHLSREDALKLLIPQTER